MDSKTTSDGESSNWEEIGSSETLAATKTETKTETSPADQPKKLILSLNYSTKELINLNLGKYTAILLGKSISKGAQKKLVHKTNTLISSLIELKVREENESKASSEPTADNKSDAEQKPEVNQKEDSDDSNGAPADTANSTKSSEMVKEVELALEWKLRAKIIDQLVISMNAAVLNCESFKDQKAEIVKQNNELNKTLIDLAVSVTEHAKLESDDDELDEEEQKAGEESEKIKADKVTKAELIEDVAKLKAAVKELNEKFDRLAAIKSQELVDPSINSEIVFDLQVKKVANLIENKDLHYSEIFYCQGLPWQVRVCVSDLVHDEEVDKTKTRFVGVFVSCENNSNYPGNWSIKAAYEIRLLNNLPDKRNKLAKFYSTYNKIAALGAPKFITASELLDEKKGWIQNDTIKLQIYLRAEKLIRK